MSEAKRCVDCGRPLALGGPAAGLCPSCLLALGRTPSRTEYTILAPLGAGRIGPLFLASPESDARRRVSLKYVTPPPGVTLDPGRFDDELVRLVTVSHPHLVSIKDGGWIDEARGFVVSDFFPGGAIDLYFSRASPPADVRRGLLAEVADAIACAHRCGVCHGGLTASDVIVTIEAGRAWARVRDVGLRGLTGREADVNNDLAALDDIVRSLAG